MRPNKNNITTFMRQPEYRPLRIRELARTLKVPQKDYRSFRHLVEDMVNSGELVELRRKRFALPGADGFCTGQFHGHQGGYGFVVVNSETPDVFINSDNMGKALHGDTVMVRLHSRRRGLNPEGAVLKVIERGKDPILGTYRRDKKIGYVIPDDARMNRNILISKQDSLQAETGQKVIVHVIDWASRYQLPQGKITEVIGHPDDPGMEILSLIRSFDLPLDFPDPVLEEAAQIPEDIPESLLKNRLDLRNTRCITIDPPTARDFDDAVSIEQDDKGHYRLGVHIADVAAYVPEGSLIDKEALYRGTSVYLVDRVIPMLPHRLTNEICSLNPGVDRLAMSIFMTIDPNGLVKDYDIHDSVIRSARRLTYLEAQTYIDEAPGSDADGDTRLIAQELRMLRNLSKRLMSQRMEQGSLDFDLPEPLVLLDEEGKPIDVRKEERLDSNRLIEECMLIANKTIAGHLFDDEVPSLYRIHEKPGGEKLKELMSLLEGFGYQISPADVKDPKKLQAFLSSIQDKPEHVVINHLVVRSMKKARYAVDNLGHYGLAFEHYTHFTSPIRRYPDLVIHRLLRAHQQGNLNFEQFEHLEQTLIKTADITSQREKLAEEAERESIKLKQVEFMEGKIEEEFDGVISGVVAAGIFVELETSLIDGMIHVSNLTDDYYIFDQERRQLVGERRRQVFRLGARVRIRVLKTDRRLRRIDFELVKAYDTNHSDKKPQSRHAGEKRSTSSKPSHRRYSSGRRSANRRGRKRR